MRPHDGRTERRGWRVAPYALAAAASLVLGGSAPARPPQGGRVVVEGTVFCRAAVPMVVAVDVPGSAAEAAPPRPAVLDQRGLEFVPHVLPVRVGTRVAFLNSDPVLHNVFSASRTKLFNLGTYPRGVTRYVTFDRPGVVNVLCNVHHEMGAYIVVLETPYFTVTDGRGRYRIEAVPAGEATVSVWCEVHGWRREAVRLAGAVATVDVELDPPRADERRARPPR